MLDFSPLLISLKIAVIATTVTFLGGIGASYFMHRYRGRWRSPLDSLLLAPMVLPPTILGFLLLLLLGNNSPLGPLLQTLGINVVFTWYAAVITATVVALPLFYKTVLGAFEQIDPSLLQAARTLGASDLRVFWRITVPLALPGILAGTTLAFTRALGEFGATLMLAGNIPGKTQTLPMAIYFAVEAGNFAEAAVWTGVILAIALGGLFLVNRWQTRHRPQLGRKSVANRPSIASTPPHRHRRETQPPLPSINPPADESHWLTRLKDLPHTLLHYLHPNFVTSPYPEPHLEVTIVKHLPNFTLNVSFDSDQQPLGLLGGSGAGKSLILRCIAGLEAPDAGRIVLNGRILFDSAQGINLPSADRRVGVLFQNYALFPHLTVAQNIAFGLSRHLSPQARQEIIQAQLETVQLQGMGHRYPAELSGGQQQRVGMARVLANQPEVLLLDEPLSALDTHLRSVMEWDLRQWLANFGGVTLFVTHNIEEAYRICPNLLVMDQGCIRAHRPKAAVLGDPQNVSTARLTGCKNISRARPLNDNQIQALDWDCTLHITHPIPADLTHVGLRAHQFAFLEALNARSDVAATESSPTTNTQIFPHHSPQAEFTENPLREHEVSLVESPAVETAIANTFPCWLAMTSETPHRMTLYLKLNQPPAHPQDYHLQAEVFKEKWAVLQTLPLPWSLVLLPEKLMLLGPQ